MSAARWSMRREHDAARALDAWLELLPGRFYLELQRLGRPFEETYIAGAVALAARRGVPVVATNDVRFLSAERVRVARGARVHPGWRAARRYRPRAPLLAPAVPAHPAGDGGAVRRRARGARQLGGDRAPLQPGADPRARRACRNTRCPAGSSTEEFLRAESARGLERRFAARRGSAAAALPRAPARASSTSSARWALPATSSSSPTSSAGRASNGVPVGPGRGSGAGSLVAYCLRHHRPRPDPLRPAVRALPESRARLDARLRHRLLHGRPRPGHRLRGAEVRPRARLADHHLRHAWRRRRWCATSAACSA